MLRKWVMLTRQVPVGMSSSDSFPRFGGRGFFSLYATSGTVKVVGSINCTVRWPPSGPAYVSRPFLPVVLIVTDPLAPPFGGVIVRSTCW